MTPCPLAIFLPSLTFPSLHTPASSLPTGSVLLTPRPPADTTTSPPLPPSAAASSHRATVDGGAGTNPAPAFDDAEAGGAALTPAPAPGAAAEAAAVAGADPGRAQPPLAARPSAAPPAPALPTPAPPTSAGLLGYRYTRRRCPSPIGFALMTAWLAALAFYIYVRITKTLDLGRVLPYGIALLVVEIAGSTTVAIYGVNLLFVPLHEEPVLDSEGKPIVALKYHIRVLVPCYKEDLDIVQRTVLAAGAAPLPAGCGRTVYLCDDGKDAAKRAWVASLGPGFVYVSGRTRKKGEMNGKSANLNNVCGQLYPEGVAIPGSELICVFDADQVVTSRFFAKTVPLFDGGDDVAMVLSPQVREREGG